MSWMTKGIRVVATAALAMLVIPAVQAANCPDGSFATIGSAAFMSTIEWNFNDPKADFSYYFVADPTVNEGRLGEPDTFRGQFGYLCVDAGTCEQLDESFASAINIAANTALGTNNCPLVLTNRRAVFIFTDSKGSVFVSVDAGTSTDWDFDRAAANSPTISPAFAVFGSEARVLTRSGVSRPRITSAVRNADDTATVALAWDPPQVWTDGPAVIGVGRYDILSQTVPNDALPSPDAPLSPVTDADLDSTNTSGRVVLPPTPGMQTYLFVRSEFAGSNGRGGVSGASQNLITDPALALSGQGKGKGKGLTKAPGQNK